MILPGPWEGVWENEGHLSLQEISHYFNLYFKNNHFLVSCIIPAWKINTAKDQRRFQACSGNLKHIVIFCVCACYWLSSKQMEEDANEAWLFGQGFLNPSQKWSMRHVCQLSQKQQRGKNVIRKLGTASSENAIFHRENMARETMCSGSRQAGWSNRIKRAVLFLREMLRKDAHSFVPQVFHLLPHKECMWSQLVREGLGLPDKPWELVSRSS